MSILKRFFLAFLTAASPLMFFVMLATASPAGNIVTVPTSPIPAAPDFATTQLNDPWDMNGFNDVSTYFNGSGRFITINNPTFQNGVFSGTTAGGRNGNIDKMAEFWPLFPGYHYGNGQPLIRTGKLGSLHPIDPSLYKCAAVAMWVNSPVYDPQVGADGFRFSWYKDQTIAPRAQSPNGGTIQIYSHMPDPFPTRNWKLYMIDLTNPPNGIYSTSVPWYTAGNVTYWQGLEFSPSLYANVNFSIDWIRLTNNCNSEAPYQASITFTSDSSLNALWINPVGTSNNIRVSTNVNGYSGSYTLNTKGIAPGSYRVGLGKTETCCTQWSSSNLVINDPPTLTFNRPSTVSGEDYATSTGQSWDMNNNADVTSVQCASFTISQGLLNITSNYPALLQQNCLGSVSKEADPKVYLNTPISISPGSGYRYLTFRMFQNGSWQETADGMIVRWVWRTSDNCMYSSLDIPLDVGWNTYTIDLDDPASGTPVFVTPPCQAGNFIPWKNVQKNIIEFRIDPNENWTGNYKGGVAQGDNPVPAMVFNQQIDNIRLTKMDTVKKGSAFPISYTLNKQVSSISFYYTTTSTQPTQNLATRKNVTSSNSGKPFSLFIPVVNGNTSFPSGQNSYLYQWDTSPVPLGIYYICSVTTDNYNTTTNCSSAPIQVTN